MTFLIFFLLENPRFLIFYTILYNMIEIRAYFTQMFNYINNAVQSTWKTYWYISMVPALCIGLLTFEFYINCINHSNAWYLARIFALTTTPLFMAYVYMGWWWYVQFFVYSEYFIYGPRRQEVHGIILRGLIGLEPIDWICLKVINIFSTFRTVQYLFFWKKGWTLAQTFITDIYGTWLLYPGVIFAFFLFLGLTVNSLLNSAYLGLYGIFVINVIGIFSCWLGLTQVAWLLWRNNTYFFIHCWDWFIVNPNLRIGCDFFIDNIAVSFAWLTVTIGLFVICYAFAYFRYEPLVTRLLLLLDLFICSMVLLVCSGNLIMLLIGWELIGLTSFFLINFWTVRIGTLKAGFKAFTFNKVSDAFLFTAVLLLFNITLSVDIVTILRELPVLYCVTISFCGLTINYLLAVGICLFIAICVKSAQIGGHLWLPDSMEAPVPASALIHSATLVSAGIFLLLRFITLFEHQLVLLQLIGCIGGFTALYGGIVAAYQNDIKRILAYSTISHCGFLVVLCICQNYEYTILYLYAHGFFKASVFLSVGNVIRFSQNNQDLRTMGGYFRRLPFDCLAMTIGLINLAGLPFTFGYLIKHVLFIGLADQTVFFVFIGGCCIGGALTGPIYTYRLLFLVFFNNQYGGLSTYASLAKFWLLSKHYTNTGLGSNIAVGSLVLVGSFILMWIFYFTINGLVPHTGHYSTIIPTVDINSLSANLNGLLINTLVALFYFSLVFTMWRRSIERHLSIEKIVSLGGFMVCFKLFLIILL